MPPWVPSWPVAALMLALALIEAGLMLGDAGLIGPAGRLRQSAYEHAGFWPGLLHGWTANYPGQAWAMFATYAFLHGGLAHLSVNLVTLWSLGQAAVQRVGAAGFLALYAASMLGGAGGYGLLARTAQPMVGASGALFGLAGGLLAWNYVDRFTARARPWPVLLRVLAMLVAMNLAMYWGFGGRLAWQAHLGGFVTGWIAALLIDPRPRAGG